MRLPVYVVLIASLSVSGCARIADSRFNPLNWFGSATNVLNTNASGEIRPLTPDVAQGGVIDNRVLIASASELRIDRTPDGAIVRATGQVSGQGFYNAELVPITSDGSVLTLAFRVAPPAAVQAGSQTVTAAFSLTNAQLAGIRTIQVQAAGNTLSSRR